MNAHRRKSNQTGVLSVLTALGSVIIIQHKAYSLELKDAIKIGIQNSTEYQSADSQLRESEFTRSKYWGSLLPSIQGKGNFESRRDSATSRFTDPTEKESYLASVELTQPIYAGGAMLAGIELGRRGVEYATQIKLITKQTTVRSIIETYLDVAQLKQQLSAATEHQLRLKAYADVTGRYAKIGRSREIDNIQSQVNLELSAQDVQNLEKDLQSSSLNLASILQTSITPDSLKVLPESIKKIQLPTLADAVNRAETQNPEVRSKQIAIEKLKATSKIELSTDMPSLNFYASTGYVSPVSSELWVDRNRFHKLGFTLTIPLFSGLTSVNERRIQKESEYQATKELELSKKNLRTAIESVISSVQLADRKMGSSVNILAKARRAFDLANKGHASGIVSSQDLIAFQRSRYEAEKLAIRSRYEYEKTLLELRYLIGTDLEEVYSR